MKQKKISPANQIWNIAIGKEFNYLSFFAEKEPQAFASLAAKNCLVALSEEAVPITGGGIFVATPTNYNMLLNPIEPARSSFNYLN